MRPRARGCKKIKTTTTSSKSEKHRSTEYCQNTTSKLFYASKFSRLHRKKYTLSGNAEN